MAYGDFSLEEVERRFGIKTGQADLFPGVAAALVPEWLPEQLARGTALALVSEKARSEFIVAPILTAARELSGHRFAIFSGQRFDVDPVSGLSGECDFILALGEPVPPLRAPILTMVEAKKNDIEAGLGQCVAQMVAARKFNEASGPHSGPVHGCVTTGEAWQFLRLDSSTARLHQGRYYLDNLGGILGVLTAICSAAIPVA